MPRPNARHFFSRLVYSSPLTHLSMATAYQMFIKAEANNAKNAGRKFSMKNAAAKWRASGKAAPKKAKKSGPRKTRSNKGKKRAWPVGSGLSRISGNLY